MEGTTSVGVHQGLLNAARLRSEVLKCYPSLSTLLTITATIAIMVLIHIKRTDADQFLFECRAEDACDAVIRALVSGVSGERTCWRARNATITRATH